MLVTKAELFKARTEKGGFTNKQVRLAQKITGSQNWLKSLVGMQVPDDQWLKFVNLRNSAKKKKTEKPKILNPFTTKTDWAWKPKAHDIPGIKVKKGKLKKDRGLNRARRQLVSEKDDKDFYLSREWKALRVRVLEKYGCACMMCGRSPKTHGVVIHVDHIKPRSKFPALSLDFENLQILCEDCNLGKGNRFDTDHRPDKLDESERELLNEALDALGGNG